MNNRGMERRQRGITRRLINAFQIQMLNHKLGMHVGARRSVQQQGTCPKISVEDSTLEIQEREPALARRFNQAWPPTIPDDVEIPASRTLKGEWQAGRLICIDAFSTPKVSAFYVVECEAKSPEFVKSTDSQAPQMFQIDSDWQEGLNECDRETELRRLMENARHQCRVRTK